MPTSSVLDIDCAGRSSDTLALGTPGSRTPGGQPLFATEGDDEGLVEP